VYVLLQLGWWGYLIIREDLPGNRTAMVIGEGLVFAAILIFAFVKLQQGLSREINLVRKEKNFMLAVSHELKTPIAAIKLSLDALKRNDLPLQKQTTLLHHSSSEIRRLQSLTDNILLASQLDQIETTKTTQVIPFSEILLEECKRFQIINGRDITMNIISDVHIRADSEMMRALFSNLLDNAIKYSSPESSIQVSLTSESHQCQLRIADEGIGIADSEKTKIFERFYRSNDEITRSAHGTGIGLYIVKSICQLHHFKIKVENNLPQGSIFIIQFAV